MKLSLAWIFDHIRGSWQEQDVALIIKRFNQVTAEIEHFHTITYPLDQFFLAVRKPNSFEVVLPELGRATTLPARGVDYAADLTHAAYLVRRDGTDFRWATLADFGVDKDGLVPAVYATPEQLNGSWRNHFVGHDVIFDVDNKSITHRPDMWGHRGFAREIAAFLGLPLRPVADFLREKPVMTFAQSTRSEATLPVQVDNQAPGLCRVFNGLYFPKIENRPSDLFMLSRLMVVGARPINALVDLTNYLTLDWSQPVHAYDAAKIAGAQVVIRAARPGEQLVLLDDNKLELTPEDVVIADAEKPMCLAGVKGGLLSGVSATTESIFFEAANFEAGSVRRSALRHKTRTDSSARFEKTLDPNQALQAVERFLALADQIGLAYTAAPAIASVGERAAGIALTVSHAYLEARSGLTLQPDVVADLLGRIECHALYDAEKGEYQVAVPTFRSSKDITAPEDILEEVVRLVGFEKIPLVLPTLSRQPYDLAPLLRHRHIRNYLADVAGLTESKNYAFYDELSLQDLRLEQASCARLVNPVSENFARLVSSLVPNLLKNLKENHVQRDGIRFFESGRVWLGSGDDVVERKSLAAVWYEKRQPVSFFQVKQWLWDLFGSLGFDTEALCAEKVQQPAHAWYKPFQTARITYHGCDFGIFGQASPLMLANLDIIEGADAVIAELDLEAILAYRIPQRRFAPFSRFQETFFDVSVMVPVSIAAQTIKAALAKVDGLVCKVELIDFFEKEAWDSQRSLTLRVWLSDFEGTLEKSTIDQVRQQAVDLLAGMGAKLRE